METKAKRLNILAIYLTLVLILSSCSLFKKDISPTPTIPPTQSLETPETTSSATPTPTPTPYYTPDIPTPTVFPTFVPEDQLVVNPFRIYNSQTFEFDVLNLAHRYSDILEVEVFGKSYMGKKLYVVKLGKGSTKVLVTGTTHARENITTNYIMRTIEEYAISYLNKETYDGYNVYEILNKVTIYYVP
ncbi:MAG: hypothetical protein GX166_12705, partial [Clostridiaceae bacterium]|nr:hypothetical protein [Clostridiaceae bacterium]